MWCSFLIFPEIAVKTLLFIIINNQRIIFPFVEFIEFLCPGIIWLYYGLDTGTCKSPVDEEMAFMVICYFVASILLLIPLFISCLNCSVGVYFAKSLMFIYLAGKCVVTIKMLTHIQKSYYKDWKENICNNLQTLSLFWLIWNYIAISLTFIYFIGFLGSSCCDSYGEYDYEEDIDT